MMTDAAHSGNEAMDHGAVVVGGSAGALDALVRILERLPKEIAVPIAVVIHTARDQPSALASALSYRCALPVREPFDKEQLQAGIVFVAASGYHLLVERGPAFAFSVDAPENFSQPSIDVLFESAADVYRARLIAVVLSGANHDGARGLATVCRMGGIALVQAPSEAASPQMPMAAIEACPKADVLPADRIADRIVSVLSSRISR